MAKVGGEDEAEWLVKDISTCVLSGDPECALAWGEVKSILSPRLRNNQPHHHIDFESARGLANCLSLWSGAIL